MKGIDMLWRTKQSGVATIELAFVIITLLMIAFGITEFGRAFYQYNMLAKSARNAARYLSTQAPGSGIPEATCLAVYGNQLCTPPKILPDLTTAMVHVCDASLCPTTHSAGVIGGGMNLVTVTISGDPTPYPFTSVMTFVVPNIDFGPISVTMHQVS